MKIVLSDTSCNLLCLYYENDINGLNQILYQLSIIYPNKKLSYTNIKSLIIDSSSNFNLEYLLENILKGHQNRSNYILKKLKTENTIKPLTILHTVQYTVLFLVVFKRQLLVKYKKKSLISLFNQYKIKKNHHSLFVQALNRLTLQKLYQVITLSLQMEIIIHQEHTNVIWNNFQLLIWLLCTKNTISQKNL